MKVFYGSAIQGAQERGVRQEINSAALESVRALGHTVLSEHTRGRTKEEVATFLEESIGPLPLIGVERQRYVRQRMIDFIEEPDLEAAIFEVSIPSSGTGIELAHAYLRPRLGIPEVPILILYERNYWVNGLSSMISGIPFNEMSSVQLAEYSGVDELDATISGFFETRF